MTKNIKVIIKTVPHPDPKRAVDLMAQLVLKDIIKAEEDEKNKGVREM